MFRTWPWCSNRPGMTAAITGSPRYLPPFGKTLGGRQEDAAAVVAGRDQDQQCGGHLGWMALTSLGTSEAVPRGLAVPGKPTQAGPSAIGAAWQELDTHGNAWLGRRCTSATTGRATPRVPGDSLHGFRSQLTAASRIWSSRSDRTGAGGGTRGRPGLSATDLGPRFRFPCDLPEGRSPHL